LLLLGLFYAVLHLDGYFNSGLPNSDMFYIAVCVCRHCARGVVMEIRRPATPPTAADHRLTPARVYALTDDVIAYSSSDDDDDDDSSLNLSSLNDDDYFH